VSDNNNNNEDSNVTPIRRGKTKDYLAEILEEANQTVRPPSWSILMEEGIEFLLEGNVSIIGGAYALLDTEGKVIWTAPLDAVNHMVMLDNSLEDDEPHG